MHIEDTYREISATFQAIYKEKGSKFIAHAFPVKNEKDINNILTEIKKKYHDARHYCYSWILNPDKSAYRINDDGEPSGSAGRPIHRQLLSYNLTNTLLVVVRYFGGTKLGLSGLTNAYKTAARDVLKLSNIVEKKIKDTYLLDFTYDDLNTVMKILKDEDLNPFDQDFGVSCKLKFSVRKKESERIFQKFEQIHTIKIKYTETI
jgi:uncharacterized YigZ family protein